jgi:predicted DCC family thiol-disulfide oxidoreductase YuxK
MSVKSKKAESRGSPSKVILYDGMCNMCNSLVDLLLRLDKEEQFSFSALQSPRGRKLLELIGKDKDDISSVVYIKYLDENKNEVYFRSDAALKVRGDYTWCSRSFKPRLYNYITTFW